MTRDEIMNMPAGRDMDALIAVHVFGWQWRPWPGNDEQKVLVQFPEQSTAIDWWGKDILALVPCYSTDISAAWEVVNHMFVQNDQRLFLRFQKAMIELNEYQIIKPGWLMSRNICRAVLLAVSENVGA